MKLDFAKLETPAEFDVDVCIVGAGAAGYTLARELKDTGKRVLVVTGGRAGVYPEEQALYEAEVVGQRYEGHVEGRFRADGGSTTRWGGQLLPLEPQDFARRDWIPESGWPVGLEELNPYYDRAIDLMGTETRDFDATVYDEFGVKPPAFDPAKMVVRFSQWVRGNRRNFAEFLDAELNVPNVQILLDAHVLRLNANDGKVESADLASLGGRRGMVKAKTFVLAAGGIENPRLLLASGGLGNAGDRVGRCYQDHLSFPMGRFAREDARQVQAWFQPMYNAKGILRTAKISMTAQAQEEAKCLNVMALVAFPYPESSAPMAARRILSGLRGSPRALPNPKDVWQAFVGLPDLGRVAFSQLVLKKRAVPRNAAAELVLNMEQAPNRESRIELAETKDALGVPKARIRWSLTPLEAETLQAYVRTFDAEWKRLGMRPVEWEPCVREGGDAYLAVVEDIYHHMGGTRMADSPERGVVDANTKVFGTENLYVAGSSVFPTGGSSNPSLTLIALAIRLADHLKA